MVYNNHPSPQALPLGWVGIFYGHKFWILCLASFPGTTQLFFLYVHTWGEPRNETTICSDGESSVVLVPDGHKI